MKKGLLVFIVVPVLIGYAIFTINDCFEFSKHPQPYLNGYKCRYLADITPGPEDITAYNSSTLLVSQADLGHLFSVGDPERTLPGAILAIYNAD
jgi:hypothetical protein